MSNKIVEVKDGAVNPNIFLAKSDGQALVFIRKKPDNTKKREGIEFLPIGVIEKQLDILYGVGNWVWRLRDGEPRQILNSMVATGDICVWNERRQEFVPYMSGTGAQPLQSDKGKKVALDSLKNNAIQLAAPSASSYALSNAAQRIGRVFGRSLNGRLDDTLDMTEDEKAKFNAEKEAKQAEISAILGK